MRDEWVLRIPAPAPMLSANNRGRHWAARASMVKAWREAAFWHAKAADLPTDLERVEFHAALYFTTNRNRDRENYYDTTKALIDGLARGRGRVKGYGLIPDDGPDHVDVVWLNLMTELASHGSTAYGLVELTIVDLSSTVESGK